MRLVLTPSKGSVTTFFLEVPDYDGKQGDRLPLPENYVGQSLAETLHFAAIGNFINRDSTKIERAKRSPFPQLSVKIQNPDAPGMAAVIATHVPH